jgi:hypothetical protein
MVDDFDSDFGYFCPIVSDRFFNRLVVYERPQNVLENDNDRLIELMVDQDYLRSEPADIEYNRANLGYYYTISLTPLGERALTALRAGYLWDTQERAGSVAGSKNYWKYILYDCASVIRHQARIAAMTPGEVADFVQRHAVLVKMKG